MRGISLKAFIAGNILSVAIPFTAALALGFVVDAVRRQSGGPFATAPHGISGQDWAINTVAIIGSISAIAAGFVSASMAGGKLLLNAGLSSVLLMGGNIYLLTRPDSGHHSLLDVITSWSVTFLAVFGGYLRARSVAHDAGPIR